MPCEQKPIPATHLSHKCVVSGCVTGLDVSLDQPVSAPLDQLQAVVPLASTVMVQEGGNGAEAGQQQQAAVQAFAQT